MVALLLMLGALCLYLSGQRRVDRLFGLWVLLFFLVRLPDQVERRLLSQFEGLSTKVASVVIDYFGSYHVVQSDLIIIDGHEIDVDLICNGYFSIFTMAALAGVYALWRRRSLVQVLCLVPGAMVVAAAVNVLRLAFVGVYFAKTGVDITEGSGLYWMLLASLVVGVLGLLSLDALLQLVFGSIDLDGRKSDGSGLVRVWNALVGFSPIQLVKRGYSGGEAPRHGSQFGRGAQVTVGVCFLLTLIFNGLILKENYGNERVTLRFMHDDKSELAELDPEQIRFTRPGWQLLSTETEERSSKSIWGQFSYIWKLQYQEVVVVMALDYPFDKWHDVRVCYTNLGWKVQTMAMSPLLESTGWGASETQMSLPTGDYALIMCSHNDHLGEVVQPKPTDQNLSMVMHYLHPKQWQEPFKLEVDKDKNTFYQTQLMITNAFALDEPTKQEIREMYGEFREQVRQIIAEQANE